MELGECLTIRVRVTRIVLDRGGKEIYLSPALDPEKFMLESDWPNGIKVNEIQLREIER